MYSSIIPLAGWGLTVLVVALSWWRGGPPERIGAILVLAVAVLALSSFGLGSAAQADPFVGRLIGSVAASMLVGGAIKKHDKQFAAQCRLYDREGMEVYLPCDSRRPLGEVMRAYESAIFTPSIAARSAATSADCDSTRVWLASRAPREMKFCATSSRLRCNWRLASASVSR